MCDAHDPSPFDLTRRHFLSGVGMGIGAMALGGLEARGMADSTVLAPHYPGKAKRVIFLFQSGGPSQLDLFDHKPLLQDHNGQELPDSVRQGQRLTGMSGNQSSLPLAGSLFAFDRHGQCGAPCPPPTCGAPHTGGVSSASPILGAGKSSRGMARRALTRARQYLI